MPCCVGWSADDDYDDFEWPIFFAQKRPKNAKMWKCKILDTFSMTFWLRTKFLGPAKIQNWTSGSVLEIPNSWLLVVEGAAEPCRLILLISDHPIQQGYYKFWNQLFSGTPCISTVSIIFKVNHQGDYQSKSMLNHQGDYLTKCKMPALLDWGGRERKMLNWTWFE